MNDARRTWPTRAADQKPAQGGSRSAAGALKASTRGMSFAQGAAHLQPVQRHVPAGEVETRAERIAAKVAALRKLWLRGARGEVLHALLAELEPCDAPLIAEIVAALLPELGDKLRPVVRVMVMTDVALDHLREARALVAALPPAEQAFGAALAVGRPTAVLFGDALPPEAQAALADEEQAVSAERAAEDARLEVEDDRSEAATIAAATPEVGALARPIREAIAAGAFVQALHRLCAVDSFDAVVHTLDDGAIAALLAGLSFDEKWNVHPERVGRVLGARSPEANGADALDLMRAALSPEAAYAAFRFLKALPPAHRDRFEQIHPELVTKVHMSLNESMRAAADTNFFGGAAEDTVAGLLAKLDVPATWQGEGLEMTLAALLKAGQRAAVLAHIEGEQAAIFADTRQREAVDGAFDHAGDAADAPTWFASLAACGKLDTDDDTLNHGTMATLLGKDGVTAAIGQANRAHNAKVKAAKKAAKASGEALDPADAERHDLLKQLGGKGEVVVEGLPLDQLDLAIDTFGGGADIALEDHDEREPGDDTNLADVGFDRNAGTLHVACANLALDRAHVPLGAMTVDSGRATLRDLVVDATFPTAQNPTQAQRLHVSAAGLDVADVFITTPATIVGVAHIGARAIDFTMAEAALGLGSDPDVQAALALVVRHNPSRNLLSAIAQYAGGAFGLGKVHDNSAGELSSGLESLKAALSSLPASALTSVELTLGALDVQGVIVDAMTSVDALHVADLQLDMGARPSVLGERRLAQIEAAPPTPALLAERDQILAALPRWRDLEALCQDLEDTAEVAPTPGLQAALLARGAGLGYAATTLAELRRQLVADIAAGSGTIASVGEVGIDASHGDQTLDANAKGVTAMIQGDADSRHAQASADALDVAVGKDGESTTLAAQDVNANVDTTTTDGATTFAGHVGTGAIAYGDGEHTLESTSATLDVTGDAQGTHARLAATELGAKTPLGDVAIGTLDAEADLPSVLTGDMTGPLSLSVSAGPVHLPTFAYGAGTLHIAGASADADRVTAKVCVDMERTAAGPAVRSITIASLTLPKLAATALEITLPIEGERVTIALPAVTLTGLALTNATVPGLDAAAFAAATGRLDLASLQIGLSNQLAYGLRASGALVCTDLYAESFSPDGDLSFGFGDLKLADLGLDRASVAGSSLVPTALAAIVARGGSVRQAGPVTLDATYGRKTGALAATVGLGTVGLTNIHYRAPNAALDMAKADLVNVSVTASAQLGAGGLEAFAVTKVAADKVVATRVHYANATFSHEQVAESWDGKPGTIEHRHDQVVDLDQATLRELVVAGLRPGAGISATQLGLTAKSGDLAGFEATLRDNGRQVLHASADAEVDALALEVDDDDLSVDAEEVRGDADVEVGDPLWDATTTSLGATGVVAQDVHGAMHGAGTADERVALHAQTLAADHVAYTSGGISAAGQVAAEDVGYTATKDLDGNAVTKAHAGSITCTNVDVTRHGMTPAGPDRFDAKLGSATVSGFEAAALADASGLVTLHADEVVAPYGGSFAYAWTAQPEAAPETYAQEVARVASERERRDALRENTKDLLAHIDGTLSLTCLMGNPPVARTFTIGITNGVVDLTDVAIMGGVGLDVDWSIDGDGRIIAVLDTAGFGDVFTLAESSTPDAAQDDPLLTGDAAENVALADLIATQATDTSAPVGDRIAIYDSKIAKLEAQLAASVVLDRQTKTKALARYRSERAQLIAEHDRSVAGGLPAEEAGPAHLSFTNIGAQLHWDSEAPVRIDDFTVSAQSIDLTFAPDGHARYRAEAALNKVAVAATDGSLALSAGRADVGFGLDGIVPEGRVDVVGGGDTPLARNPLEGRLLPGARLVDVDVTARRVD